MVHIKQRDRRVLERRRVSAGKLFARGVSQAAVSEKYGVSRAAACQWYGLWRKDKRKGLLSRGAPGFDSQLNEKKKKQLKQVIMKGPVASGYETDFWTIDRIRAVAKKKLKVNLGYTRIWNTVIGLGFSCQKPERRARERNEKAITDWKLKEFPRLKKMGAETPVPHWVSG